MRKIIVILSFVFFILSCGSEFEEQNPGLATIRNTSVVDVIYQFGDMPEKTIGAAEEITFERPIYAYMKYYKPSEEPSKRISLKTEYPHKNDVICTFSERHGYPVSVINSTGQTATLRSAGGWMADIDLAADPAEQSDPAAWLIYTDKPDFVVTLSNGFHAEAVYSLDEVDEGIFKFKVVIRYGS